jgi:ribosomal protein S18 acetylase RimI-like enzyme
MAILVRRFEPSDQAQCRQLILSGLGEHFGFIDDSRNPDLHDIAQSYLSNSHDFYVAERDGQVVGTVGLLFEPGRARIVRMSVARKHRQQGIATALLKKCIERARERGGSDMVAFTEPHWSDAVGFYLALGFVKYGSDTEDIHLRLSLPDAGQL